MSEIIFLWLFGVIAGANVDRIEPVEGETKEYVIDQIIMKEFAKIVGKRAAKFTKISGILSGFIKILAPQIRTSKNRNGDCVCHYWISCYRTYSDVIKFFWTCLLPINEINEKLLFFGEQTLVIPIKVFRHLRLLSIKKPNFHGPLNIFVQ